MDGRGAFSSCELGGSGQKLIEMDLNLQGKDRKLHESLRRYLWPGLSSQHRG